MSQPPFFCDIAPGGVYFGYSTKDVYPADPLYFYAFNSDGMGWAQSEVLFMKKGIVGQSDFYMYDLCIMHKSLVETEQILYEATILYEKDDYVLISPNGVVKKN